MTEQIIEKNEFGYVNKVFLPDIAEQIVIQHDNCVAKISLYGGHILSWQPEGQTEVLWISETSNLNGSRPIRGGIPICWPWFGGLQGEVNHGFARRNCWQLEAVNIEEKGVEIVLSLSAQSLSAVWPFSYRVTQNIYFSTTLCQQLTVENVGNEALTFSDALHTYFSVSHPRNVSVPALNLAVFDDKITGELKQPAEQVLDCIGPVDRIYYNNESATLFDKGLNRSITINKTCSKQWVLWNPGKEIADSMADVHDGGELEFICLEAANTALVSVVPNSSVTIGQEISVTNLN